VLLWIRVCRGSGDVYNHCCQTISEMHSMPLWESLFSTIASGHPETLYSLIGSCRCISEAGHRRVWRIVLSTFIWLFFPRLFATPTIASTPFDRAGEVSMLKVGSRKCIVDEGSWGPVSMSLSEVSESLRGTSHHPSAEIIHVLCFLNGTFFILNA